MKNIKRLVVGVLFTVSSLFVFPSVVKAVCVTDPNSFLPDYIQEILCKWGFTPTGAVNNAAAPEQQINSKIRWGISTLFVVVFIIAIVYSALAGIKFISSQGKSDKLEESKAAIKAILMGFAAMIIAILGLFIVLWILGSPKGPNTNITIPT